MDPSRLKNYAVIEERTQTGVSALNEPIYAWSTFAELYVEVVTKPGREGFAANQRFGSLMARFTCRQEEIDGADVSMRLLLNDQYFNIKVIMPDWQNRDMAFIDAELQDGTA